MRVCQWGLRDQPEALEIYILIPVQSVDAVMDVALSATELAAHEAFSGGIG